MLSYCNLFLVWCLLRENLQ